MAGVEELIISDWGLAVLAIALFFSVFAMVKRTAALDAIAMVCWWITGGIHLVTSPSTSPLFSVSYLWLVLGFIFMVLMFVDVWKFFSYRKGQDSMFEAEL